MAGTAVPDWLAASDPGSRLRGRPVPLPTEDDLSPEAELCRGIRVHHADDRVFHQNPVFLSLVKRLARHVREHHPKASKQRRFKARFLAHVLIEMLLDAELMARDENLVDEYYAALAQTDTTVIRAAVDAIAPRPTKRLDRALHLFVSTQFLRSYVDDHEVAARLTYVVKRIRHAPLPDALPESIATARRWVGDAVDRLIPAPEVAAAALVDTNGP